MVCEVQSSFGGDHDDGAEDPIDDLPGYDHSVSLSIVTDPRPQEDSPEELERQENLMREMRAEHDAIRRSVQNVRFCLSTRIRFHRQLDMVLQAVRDYEFPDYGPDDEFDDYRDNMWGAVTI